MNNLDSDRLENIRTKYQNAITLKDSESQIQWNRYNAILVINTILLGLIGLNYSSNTDLCYIFGDFLQYMPLVGILICILWFIVTWKGFKWSQFWIEEANKLEKDLVGGINPIQEGAIRRSKYLKTEYAAYIIIVIFLLIYVYLLLLSSIKFPIKIYLGMNMLQISQIFNNITVGIGALLAGAGGLKILDDWLELKKENQRREKLRAELKTRYPLSQHIKTYRLIESDSKPGWVYLHDLESGKKHHIASMLTLLRLGYMRNWAKNISVKEFDLIPEGDEFLTDGERYS